MLIISGLPFWNHLIIDENDIYKPVFYLPNWDKKGKKRFFLLDFSTKIYIITFIM